MEACLSKPIQEYCVIDELMSDVTSSKFNFFLCSVQVDTMDPSLSNSTPMDPLNVTDSSPCTRRLSSLAALPQSAMIIFLPVLFGAGAAVSLQMQSVFSHSVDSSALSYTMRSPLSQSNTQNIKKL